MAVVVEGKRGIVVATQGQVVEENCEQAWAQAHVRKAPDVRWLLGNFVHAATDDVPVYNQNGHLFPYEDLKDAIQDIPYRPLNYVHQQHRRVGCFTAAEFVWPEGETAGRAEPPVVEALAAFWRYYDSDRLWPGIEMAYRDGELWFSMEGVPETVTCMVDSCGQTFEYDGPVSPIYCSHMQRPRAKRKLHKPRFVGGALIVPPTKPGDRNAHVKEISELFEKDLANTDRIYREVAQQSPHLNNSKIENIVSYLLKAGG